MLDQRPANGVYPRPPTERSPITHELKCWPEFFDAIATGRKRHDLRRASDRDFRVNDRLHLREFNPVNSDYTGRSLFVQVTYVTSADLPCALSEEALNSDFCILSIGIADPIKV
jgi:hypothetical protein